MSVVVVINVQRLKFLRLINNLNITKSLNTPFHQHLVAEISSFNKYYHSNCSQEIRVSVPLLKQFPNSATQSTNSTA